MRKLVPTVRGTSTPSGPRQVAAYIAAAPLPARALLRQLRALVRSVAPEAEERLSYGMPYYSLHGRLAYFAAFKGHVGVYLMGRSKERFARELARWRTTASTLRFEFGDRLPLALLRRVLRARTEENLTAAAMRSRPARQARATPGTR